MKICVVAVVVIVIVIDFESFGLRILAPHQLLVQRLIRDPNCLGCLNWTVTNYWSLHSQTLLFPFLISDPFVAVYSLSKGVL